MTSEKHWRTAARTALILFAVGAALPAFAQEKRVPAGTPLPDYAMKVEPRAEARDVNLAVNPLPNIMLVGYWPPTNEMIRRFNNTDPIHNPAGWIGENWEGRGYNVYSFFPEFPTGLGKGTGDFEVDYQDTSADFWYYTDIVQPLAIITFGRAGADYDWEVEDRHLNRTNWAYDYLSPWLPMPNPPDDSVGVNYTRYSTLPMQQIVDAVNDAGLGLTVYIDSGAGGTFLCEYLGYHALWYHELHADRDDPNNPTWNFAAGHIHVGSNMSLATATTAAEVSVRTLLTYLDQELLEPGDMNCDGVADFQDINLFVVALLDPLAYHAENPKCLWRNADCSGDGVVDFDDINPFVTLLTR